MDNEKALVDTSMNIFRRMRTLKDGAVNAALSRYLEILPEPMLAGMAHHKARQYLKHRPSEMPLDSKEVPVLSRQICQQILNELILKIRNRAAAGVNADLDGAELFYRRALHHIALERYADAERLLRRSVEIYPDFTDGWDVLVEVFEHNGKAELAEQARLELRELRSKL